MLHSGASLHRAFMIAARSLTLPASTSYSANVHTLVIFMIAAIAATIKAFQPLDLAPVKMEQQVTRFYPLRHTLLPEGPVSIVYHTTQQLCALLRTCALPAHNRGAAAFNEDHSHGLLCSLFAPADTVKASPKPCEPCAFPRCNSRNTAAAGRAPLESEAATR
jgi:hypothetical protein